MIFAGGYLMPALSLPGIIMPMLNGPSLPINITIISI